MTRPWRALALIPFGSTAEARGALILSPGYKAPPIITVPAGPRMVVPYPILAKPAGIDSRARHGVTPEALGLLPSRDFSPFTGTPIVSVLGAIPAPSPKPSDFFAPALEVLAAPAAASIPPATPTPEPSAALLIGLAAAAHLARTRLRRS